MRASTILFLITAGAASPTRAQSADTPVSLAVAQRTRYETLFDQFRPTLDATDRVLALQTSVVVEAGGERLRFVGEVMDSRAELNDAGSLINSTVVNTLEPIQAYMAWHTRDLFAADASSTMRVGRMTLDLGKRRLLARNRYRNTVASFTGADWHWRAPDGREARAFYFLPSRLLPTSPDELLDNEQELDRALRDATLWGGYYELAKFADESVVEVYGLDLDIDPRPSEPLAALDLFTAGARAYRPPSPARWNYEVEAVLQTGESPAGAGGTLRSDASHRARFLHLETGYQLDAPWAPNIVLQYDVASGDEDPDDATVERFNTLFGARRFDFNPTGIYGPFARSNLESPGIRVTLRPAPRLQAMLAYRAFQLEEPRDAWIGVGLRDATGAAGDSLGRQLEGSFTWEAIEDRLSLETGFALLSAGSFPERVAGTAFRGDSEYFYAALTTTF